MTKRLAASLMLLLAAACSPKAEAPKPEVAAATSPPASAAKRMPLPDCATVEAKDGGAMGWTHENCRMMSTDKVGLAFEVRYTAPTSAGEQGSVAIQVVAAGDATVQTIMEMMDNTFGAPSLRDIDGDGRDEILVPLVTGNVNTTWAVWRATGEATTYKRLEELSGVDIKHTADGMIATPGRSSANSWNVSFWRFDGEDLEPVADVEVTARGTPDKITGVDCAIEDKGGLKDLKLDAKAARAKFCAEPVVADIFK